MSKQPFLACGLAAAFLLCAFAAPPQEILKPAHQDELGKKFASYFKAFEESKGTDKALEAVIDQLNKIGKDTKKEPLSLHDDLGRALWYSLQFKDQKIKKGAVKEMSLMRDPEDPKNLLPYALWVPTKYDPKKTYPLILLVPDKGQKITDHITEKWTDAAIREGAVLCAVKMPGGETTDAWLDLSNSKEREGGLSNTLATFFDVTRQVSIDHDRVYLCGWGEGVRVVCALGARFPDRFAGVIGRSGDPIEAQPVENFRNLPTIFAGAGQGATAFSERAQALKYENVTIKPEAKEPEIWAWIQDHPRMSNPPQVVIAAPAQTRMRAYWLATQEYDSPIALQGSIDKGTNTITIEGEGATEVTILLNDELVDLDREVKFVLNGAAPLIDKIPRNVSTMLATMRTATSDTGKVFVAQRKLDLPPKPKPKTPPKGG